MSKLFPTIPLYQVAEISMGQSPDSSTVNEINSVGMPFLQGNAEFGDKHPSPKYSCIRPPRVGETGATLISVRAPVGQTNIADRDYCIGRGLAAVRAHEYGPALCRAIMAHKAGALKKVSQGTTFEAISRDDLLSLQVPRIPDAEANLIESVLDTLDTQIQKTEALIAKLEKIKEGLLHDLLTRGIDQNGQLRPTPKQAPELYKKSAIGLIPLDWHQGTISDYVLHGDGIKPGPFGSSITKNMYRRTGYKIYGQEQVIRTDHTFGNYYIDHTKYSELIGFAVQPWDILISLVGTVGKVLVIPANHEPGIINPRLMRLRPHKAKCDAIFLGHVLTSSFFTRKLIALAGGGTMPVINKRIIQNVALPVIPLLEQTEIRSRISSLLQRLDNEKALLAKLHTQKSGLMDDLLTGRVRVTPLLKDAV